MLFDQEKAYDRVHPTYLRKVMAAMGFPDEFIEAIFTLFFGTNIHLNINGYLAQPFLQQRGLRQGDPLSPLLFNIAIEPLIQSIIQSPQISGIQLPHTPSTVIKIMGYADDLATFPRTTEEWGHLKATMEKYGQASNARLNLKKTVAFPLSNTCRLMMQALQQDQVQIHTTLQDNALVYLGYPVALNTRQRDLFLDNILSKIKIQIGLHSGRQVSVLGRGLIANSLILSRLWHIVSVVQPPRAWIRNVQSVVRKFFCPFFPAPSCEFITQRRKTGGTWVGRHCHAGQSLPTPSGAATMLQSQVLCHSNPEGSSEGTHAVRIPARPFSCSKPLPRGT